MAKHALRSHAGGGGVTVVLKKFLKTFLKFIPVNSNKFQMSMFFLSILIIRAQGTTASQWRARGLCVPRTIGGRNKVLVVMNVRHSFQE